jgi:hypothetical protein
MTVPHRQIMPLIGGREQYLFKALDYFHIESGYIFITLHPLNTKQCVYHGRGDLKIRLTHISLLFFFLFVGII